MVEERDVRGHSMGQSLFMRALHVFLQSPLPRLETHDAPTNRIVSMHFPIVQPRQPFHVHVCDSRAVCKIQILRIRNVRLIRLPNSVRERTTHLKESQLDPFVPGQIQMTRKHNHRFFKRPRNVHPKVGYKKDGIRIVWLVIRESIRPPTQISKYDSGAMSTLVQQVLYRNHFLHALVSKLGPSLLQNGPRTRSDDYSRQTGKAPCQEPEVLEYEPRESLVVSSLQIQTTGFDPLKSRQ
ncbi:hypothetical protein TNCV_2790231 [Trichonephila clavipes]|nr:hypothetical protein TNCV_2790231 [Trichonephila clavipes]